MGSYCELKVGGYDIYSTKSQIDPFMAAIFRESDRRVRRVHYDAYYTDPLEDADLVDCHEYAVTAQQLKDRLDLMGFTLEKTRQVFNEGVNQVIATTQEFMEDSGEDMQDYYRKELTQLTELQNAGFERWVATIRNILEKNISKYLLGEEIDKTLDNLSLMVLDYDNHFQEDLYYGFPNAGLGNFLRAITEAVSPETEIALNLTSLIYGGYYQENDKICQNTLDGELSQIRPFQKVIVLTEGKTDSTILSRALHLLYPHLESYLSFMDFGLAKAEGGASALVTTTKSFAAAGISQKIIALFDFDAAGVAYYQVLERINNLPSNIKPLLLPHLPSAVNYPTIGPQGSAELDVNGRACSIEMYLGSQALMMEDGNPTPVKWTALNSSTREYQGEIEAKDAVQKRFESIASSIENGDMVMSQHDWSGLKSIFEMIFREAAKL
jgi:hypothetical protein